jgi:nitric-oxide synthase, bacterial
LASAAAARQPSATVLREAEAFIRQFHKERDRLDELPRRLAEIRSEIAVRGGYVHTHEELEFGARVAWRNSRRCIGRLYWRGLHVIDRRNVHTAEGVFKAVVEHLLSATNGGKIRPTITVFAPSAWGQPGVRVWNEQLVRYAGYRCADGRVIGDPRNVTLTEIVSALGWKGGRRGQYDVLPLVIEAPGEEPRLFELPGEAVLDVPLTHPEYDWFAELGLRWHAVPAISDQRLEIGGISYTCAPFNGWYMSTEIGARNLADPHRYDMPPAIADRLGLDRRSDRSLWKDRALVELNIAVLSSFERAGVTMTDHHTEARRFMRHLDTEEQAERIVPVDWSWIVPPMSGATMPVFHRYYDDADLRPNFYRPELTIEQQASSACPVPSWRRPREPRSIA